MNTILFDDDTRYRLLPFTHTRPVADIRCGILTMRKRWEHCLRTTTSTLTERYLQTVYPLDAGEDNLLVNGSIFATLGLAKAAKSLKQGETLKKDDLIIAARTNNKELLFESFALQINSFTAVPYTGTVNRLQNIWDIFALNDKTIRDDYAMLTHFNHSEPIPQGVTVVGKNQLHIEEGARIGIGTIINAAEGPVYIGKGAEIMEGSMIRGPLAICDKAVIKMGAKIYGATTIGPGCKVGGEISNVVFFANSNKGHDGYLGNAVIGEWCNLGADTNCSNLKNNYDEIKIWDEYTNKSVKTGLTFCGLLMADHSKCGINTMFNTGTVVGVSANIFGGSFPEKFIPSFSWGGSEGMTTYTFERAMDTANRMMERRNRKLTDAETEMYRHIFNNTAEQRALFNKG